MFHTVGVFGGYEVTFDQNDTKVGPYNVTFVFSESRKVIVVLEWEKEPEES